MKHSTVWMYYTVSGQIMSLYSEGYAAAGAEKYPDCIYFFADLGELEELPA